MNEHENDDAMHDGATNDGATNDGATTGTRLERDLRAGLTRAVTDAPLLPRLADDVVRRGRTARRRRVAAAGAAAVAAVATGVLVLTPVRPWAPDPVPAAPTGAPVVTLWTAGPGEAATVLDQHDGALRSRRLDGTTPVAEIPAGVLVVSAAESGSAAPALRVLGPDAPGPRDVVPGLVEPAVAVAPDGGRAVVVTGAAGARTLQEVELPSGRALRTVPLAPPLAAPQDPVRPVGYAGDAVLLAIGEGAAVRTALWEPGDDAVIGTLDGAVEAVDASARDGRGLVAVRTRDEQCTVRIVELRNGRRGWDLCGETFTGFSPGGRYVLSTTASGDGVVVRDARSGDVVHRHAAASAVAAAGWETEGSVLYAGRQGEDAVVTRCAVAAPRCAPVLTLPAGDGVPAPLPPRR